MNFREGSKILILCSIVLCAAVAMAQAPASIFQLDGNADLSAGYPGCLYTAPCDYWDLINGTGGSGTVTNNNIGHSAVSTYVNGAASTDSFTGGGSKDFYPISKWAFSASPTPNKDTLDAAYAAAYNQGDFDVIFGADRLSPNGDANIGIWFFQQSVAPVPGTGKFSGAHSNGDVFVISAFTNGGGNSTISVYSWNQPGLPNVIGAGCTSGVKNPVPGQCADANLLLLASPNQVCGSSYYCAITNSANTHATWASYSNPQFQLASPLFFEGGVDITQAFAAVGGSVPCFSSFLVETRSSQSTSAVLKDFISGGFPVCSMNITKECGVSSVNAAGTLFTYPVDGVVHNTGIGTIYNVQVFDTVAPATQPGNGISVVNTTSTSPFFNTHNLGSGDTGTWSDSSSSTAVTSSDQAYAQGSTSSNGTPLNITSTNTASAQCTASANTTLTVSKSCGTTLQTAGNGTTVSVLVTYSGQVCNTGPSQVTGISLKDYPDSTFYGTTGSGSTIHSGITLGPSGSLTACYSYGPDTYTPTAIDKTIGTGGTGAGRYFFDDLITIPTATPAIGSITVVNTPGDPRTDKTFGFSTASCPICQGSAECTP